MRPLASPLAGKTTIRPGKSHTNLMQHVTDHGRFEILILGFWVLENRGQNPQNIRETWGTHIFQGGRRRCLINRSIH